MRSMKEKLFSFMQVVNNQSSPVFFLEIQFLLVLDKVIFLYQLLDRVLCYSSATVRCFIYSFIFVKADGNESGEMTEEKNSVKIEPHPEEKLKEVDCLSWDSKPNSKRTHSQLERLYGERLESSKANKWQDERDVPMEEEPEHKRIKYDEENHTSACYREDQNMGYRSPSNVQPSLTSYLEEKQNDSSVNYSHAMTERSHCLERCFFPVDFCLDRRELTENFRYFLPPVDEDTPQSNSPDLELALGGKKPSPKKEAFQPFFPLVYDRRLDKLSDSTTAKHDDDDISESLSLSLAFPGMERKRTGTPVKRHDPPGVNTSLILFGGFSDT